MDAADTRARVNFGPDSHFWQSVLLQTAFIATRALRMVQG